MKKNKKIAIISAAVLIPTVIAGATFLAISSKKNSSIDDINLGNILEPNGDKVSIDNTFELIDLKNNAFKNEILISFNDKYGKIISDNGFNFKIENIEINFDNKIGVATLFETLVSNTKVFVEFKIKNLDSYFKSDVKNVGEIDSLKNNDLILKEILDKSLIDNSDENIKSLIDNGLSLEIKNDNFLSQKYNANLVFETNYGKSSTEINFYDLKGEIFKSEFINLKFINKTIFSDSEIGLNNDQLAFTFDNTFEFNENMILATGFGYNDSSQFRAAFTFEISDSGEIIIWDYLQVDNNSDFLKTKNNNFLIASKNAIKELIINENYEISISTVVAQINSNQTIVGLTQLNDKNETICFFAIGGENNYEYTMNEKQNYKVNLVNDAYIPKSVLRRVNSIISLEKSNEILISSSWYANDYNTIHSQKYTENDNEIKFNDISPTGNFGGNFISGSLKQMSITKEDFDSTNEIVYVRNDTYNHTSGYLADWEFHRFEKNNNQWIDEKISDSSNELLNFWTFEPLKNNLVFASLNHTKYNSNDMIPKTSFGLLTTFKQLQS